MAYTDSLQIRYFVSTPITSAPATIFDVDSQVDAVRCPTGCQLEAFGVLVTVAGTVTTSPVCVISIGKNIVDALPSPMASITLPLGALAGGKRFECGSIGGRATRVLPGQYVQISQSVQGAGSGQVEPYIVLRIDGYTASRPVGDVNPSSPLVIVFS